MKLFLLCMKMDIRKSEYKDRKKKKINFYIREIFYSSLDRELYDFGSVFLKVWSKMYSLTVNNKECTFAWNFELTSLLL